MQRLSNKVPEEGLAERWERDWVGVSCAQEEWADLGRQQMLSAGNPGCASGIGTGWTQAALWHL